MPVFDSARAEPATVAFSAGATGSYDSNLFRLSPAEKAARFPASIDDYVIEPRIGGAISLPVSLQAFELAGGLGYSFHRHNKTLDAENAEAIGRWRWQMSDLCFGAVEYRRTRRLVEFDDVELGGRRRVIQIGRATDAGGGCAITPRLRASLDYRSSERDNRDPLRRDIALDEESIEGRLNYGTEETLNLYIFGRQRDRTQPGFAADDEGSARARIRDIGGGFTWKVSPQLELRARFYRSRLRTSESDPSTSLSSDVSAEWAISGKTRLSISADKLIDVSPTISAIAFRSRQIRGEFDWEATPRLSFTLSASHRWRTIDRETTQRLERDRTASFEGSASYAFGDRLQARLLLAHRRRSANFADLRFAAATASVALTYRLANSAALRGSERPGEFR